jgi:Lrp/AsnC family transcriptional regulator for asnA, asnC and gidA
LEVEGKSMKKYRKTKLPTLDEIDDSIIQELQIDARQSYMGLGRKIGASEGTIRNRVKKLLKREIIKLKAVINPAKIGFDFGCVVGLEIAIEKLGEAGIELAGNPNVYYLVGCTGAFDLLAILMFRNTSEFDIFMRETIARLPGIKRTQTFVNMSLIKTPWVDNVDIKKLLES